MDKVKYYHVIIFGIVVTVTTLFLKLPLPSGGYFNFGDIAVVFAGLMLGWRGGLIAGGIGSALADILGGYAVFSILTLIAKGAEGTICGIAKGKTGFLYYVMPAIAVIVMVAIYFVGECFMPQIKLQGALLELVPNFIQAGGGYVGAIILFKMYKRIVE